MEENLINKCIKRNHESYLVDRAITQKEIDEVCRFRAGRFAKRGIYSPMKMNLIQIQILFYYMLKKKEKLRPL
ncbi:MAG: hypothetical protein ABIF18_03110 [archaeon]